jgi:glutathione S-transferase
MLTIHGVPISVHTRKAIVTALLKGLAFRNEPVIPFDPPENWRDLSPAGTIPALSHDGFRIADSNAICAYLDRLQPSPAIYPAEARALGHALWLEQYATSVVFRQVVQPLFHQKVIRPRILGEGGPDETITARAEETAPWAFAYLEAGIEGPYLAGSALSIADIAVVSSLINYRYLGYSLDVQRTPKLSAWLAAMLAERAVAAALADEAAFADRMRLDRSFVA